MQRSIWAALSRHKRSGRQLREHFNHVAAVTARLQQREPPAPDVALLVTIEARRTQTGQTLRQVVTQLVREMRDSKKQTTDRSRRQS